MTKKTATITNRKNKIKSVMEKDKYHDIKKYKTKYNKIT